MGVASLFTGKKRLILLSILLLVVVVLAIGLGTGLSVEPSSTPTVQNTSTPHSHYEYLPLSFNQFEGGSNLGPGGRGWGSVGVSDSKLGHFSKAAVSADGIPCADVAKEIMLLGGNAADATVAGLFCVGVINTQSMGLGGGFLLTYYDRASKTAHTLDAREVAPSAATPDMYKGDGKKSRKGALAVAVPGELRGYYELFRKFGSQRLAWGQLVEPSIRICEEGHAVNWHMARALRIYESDILNEPTMSVFINNATGRVYKEGDLLRRPQLAASLRAIKDDPDSLYTGQLKDKLLQDLRQLGSLLVERDLLDYKPKWRKPVEVSLSNGNYTLYSVPPPGSGLLLGLIMNVLDDYSFSPSSITGINSLTTYQRIVEALKFAYAKRTQLGDEDFVDMTELVSKLSSEEYAASIQSVLRDTSTDQDPGHYGAVSGPPPEDHGTAHFSLIAENGDAVSVTSTINLYFGAGLRSVQTGIVLNDEMDDFSAPNITNYFGIPPSPANFIAPGKRPLSSMSPAVIVDEAGDVRLALGAAGGTKIPSGLAYVMLNNLWFGKDLKQSVDARRIHHQLFPMTLMYEQGFNETLVKELTGLGHHVQEFDVGGSVVCAVSAEHQQLYANSDFRKAGNVRGY